LEATTGIKQQRREVFAIVPGTALHYYRVFINGQGRILSPDQDTGWCLLVAIEC